MVYLDSNVFLYALVSTGALGKHARALLSEVQQGKLESATSVITWDEVLWIARKNLSQPEGVRVARSLLELSHLEWLDLNTSILWKAADLVERYDLEPRDSLHAATAMSRGMDTIVSEDSDFDRVTELKRKKLIVFADRHRPL